ncbi:MAG: hypothetical protein DCC43_04665 [Candidatus Brocadia sp.]|jgi:cAMP-binding proteins - catabolite gene activator and regulatory subunit of cAMP-dependent protein kinases|uniref:Transcriptional regulator of Crp/Fnr family protein n=1 Tax=Candidatus Brocadia fulgida TaxID=380242 RepID=A0A0M2UYV0_9BACT|nr:MAG: transcriptional regulator of Crp/Fnr family protein [Candidatus Brocadia fulgida]MCC6324992.1 cyclic nucleotide-binding domain-containing protein [Candidatus Brocadia sp.]MCE7910696.1 cyclic nucleotide-binding domain-containing protein [Candidatus Brocadia sp. AMX3]MBV6519894.1 hypothetical protein [Candidatus Brocadia fulgida]MDG5996371.1 cyclic nucleotide-binding domain-containing protein [Candidatus Brocadia sp.]
MSEESLLGRLYKDNETIVEEGMQSRTMYVIQGGKVKVVKNDNGNETILALLGEGDIFGEMSLFDASPRSATIKAIGEARVLAIEHEGLLKRIKMDPTLALRMIKQMCQRIRDLNARLIAAKTAMHQASDGLVQMKKAEVVSIKDLEPRIGVIVTQLQEKLRALTEQYVHEDESLHKVKML